MMPTGYWVWFDGRDIYLYGEPTGRVCPDEGFESVYVYDTLTRKPLGYKCVLSLDKVKKLYEEKKAPDQYIFIRDPPKSMNMYDALNALYERDIIVIPELKK